MLVCNPTLTSKGTTLGWGTLGHGFFRKKQKQKQRQRTGVSALHEYWGRARLAPGLV